MPPANLKAIQALRAAACLLVVAYHALEGAWANGAAGVDVFFVISGLVMGISSAGLRTRVDGWRVFARRRLCRLVPLYWGLTLAKLAIGLALPTTLAAARPGIWNVVASFLFIPARDGAGMVRPVLGVGWTLQFEALFYALFALALAWRRPPLCVVLPLLLPLAAAGFWRIPDWPALAFWANGLVLEFCLGLVLAEFVPCLERMPAFAAGALAVGGSLTLLMAPSAGAWRFACWGLPAACVVAGASGLERTVGQRLPRVLPAVGEASFAIYLLHPFLTPPLVQACHAVLGTGFVARASAATGSLLVSAFAGWMLHHYGDRKVQAWLRGRSAASASMPTSAGQLVQS